MVGGVGSIVSGGLALGAEATAVSVVGITAGAGEAAVGSLALFADTEHEFRHRRNLLQEVWAGPKPPRLLPDSVWRFINRPSPDGRGGRTLRETLLDRWRREGRLGETGSEDERHGIGLFFGSGGTYTIDELRDRANMLEADINLMSHDLDDLLLEILVLTDSVSDTATAVPTCGGPGHWITRQGMMRSEQSSSNLELATDKKCSNRFSLSH